MKDIYGEDLTNVPPSIRLKFQNDTGTSWEETTYDEREEFLIKWQARRSADLAKEKARAKEISEEKKLLAKKERQKAKLKQEKDRLLLEKERAKMKQKREEEKKKRELVKKRKDAMRELKKNQARRARENRS